jgi:hypothetical protein
LPDPEVLAALKSAGIRRIVAGHTPNGSTPTVLRGDGVEILIPDNTYANHASRVLIDGPRVSVDSEVRDSSGELRKLKTGWKVTEDSPIGKRVTGGDYLVAGKFENGEWLLFRVLPGFNTEEKILPANGLQGVRLELPYRHAGFCEHYFSKILIREGQ